MIIYCLISFVWTEIFGVEFLVVLEILGIFCFLVFLFCDVDDFVELFLEDCLNFFSFKIELL